MMQGAADIQDFAGCAPECLACAIDFAGRKPAKRQDLLPCWGQAGGQNQLFQSFSKGQCGGKNGSIRDYRLSGLSKGYMIRTDK